MYKLSALIPIKLSYSDLKVEQVETAACPWVGLDFLEHLPRTHKAYWYLSTFKNGYLKTYIKIQETKNILTLEILPKIRQSFVYKLIKIPLS